MSLLTLVRHGQASFFEKDYDRLSPLGEKQARLLGAHWAGRGVAFDEVYTGPRVRQRETAALVGQCYADADVAWPAPIVWPELDEYDLAGISERVVPELACRDATFRDLLQSYQHSTDAERPRSFQRMFEVLTLAWMEGTCTQAGLEPWTQFRDRVMAAIQRIMKGPGNGRRVVLFTSGGFIGTTLQWALGARERMALELSWRLRNGAVSQFVFTTDRLTLDTFNEVPHLEDTSLWTYR